MGHQVVEIARYQDVASLRFAVLPDVVRQFGEILDDRLALEVDVVPVEGRRLTIGLEVIAPFQQPLAVVESLEIRTGQICGQVLQVECLQPGAEQLHAVFAEAASVAGGEDGQVGFVKLDARYPGIDLDADDRFQILTPDRVVAVHQVGIVLVFRHLDPRRVAGFAVDVARYAFLQDVGDLLAVAVVETLREVVLQWLPQLRIPVLGELAQPDPVLFSDSAQLVHGEDLVLLLVELNGELPTLNLEDDAENLDALLLTRGNELGIIHEPVEPEARVDLVPGLVFEIRKRDGATSEGRPDE